MQTKPFKLLVLILTSMFSLPGVGEESFACLQCHSKTADEAVHAIFHTAHANLSSHIQTTTTSEDPNLTCVACHGISSEHKNNPIENAPEISFGPRWPSSADKRDEMCLSCHAKGKTLLWAGSEHQIEELSCSSCHSLHTQIDPVLQKHTQSAVCTNCHTQQLSQARLPSHHPITEGKTVCTDCHNPHGTSNEFMLTGVTLNDTCFSCHAEKRGPFLFDHAPVEEDCSTCHDAHGTVNDNLLTSRGPFLCQQCHSAAFHPSLAFSGADVAEANQNVVGKNCLNCHSQVHGSNHPSGAYLTR